MYHKTYKQMLKWSLYGRIGVKKVTKKQEKNWALKVLKKTTKNWSSLIGEKLVFETLRKFKQKPQKPIKKLCYVPDIETKDYIYEVKTRNWNTTGTAGEKVFGTPMKYAEIPRLYNKPLRIVCVAFQEYEMEYGKTPILGDKVRESHQKFLDFYKENNITFIKFSDLLKELKTKG